MAAVPFQDSYPMKPTSPAYTQLSHPPTAYDPSKPPNPLYKKLETTKKRIRLIRTTSRPVPVLLNTLPFSIMAFTISVFLSTRHDTINTRNVWPADSKTWPTIMLLVGSLVTLTLEIFVL